MAEKSTIKIKEQSANTPAKKVEPRPETTEELMARISQESVGKTLEAVMPMFERLMSNVESGRMTPAQAKREASQSQRVMNDRQAVVNEMNREFNRQVTENKRFMEKLARSPESDYTTIRIPRVFKQYFGSALKAGLNGSVIQIPIDGRSYKIHKKFLPIIQRKLDYEDQKIDFMERSGYDDTAEVSDIADASK